MNGFSFKVTWTPTANRDLTSILVYIAEQSGQQRAHGIYQRLKKEALRLTHFAHQGRIVPELKLYNINTHHELIVNPWRIIYRIDGRSVYIIAVIDGRRNVEDVLFDRLIKV
jgi:addiction module RelE/StbE family toxin